jgi:ribosome-associated translation inhibitor RaiA
METNRELRVRIAFRDIEPSEALEAAIRRHAEGLRTFDARVQSCDVAVEAPHRHKHHGRDYRVRIDLVTPGAEIVTDKTSDRDGAFHDVYAAIDEAFTRAARKLRDHVESRAGRVRESRSDGARSRSS